MSVETRELIVRTGLADEIAYRVGEAILKGEFPPGSHLQQDELCSRFGVSRTPVREALRKLQAQNLVDLVPNRGATVRRLTRSDFAEVYALRAELEGFAVELAADRITTAELEKLAACIEAAKRALASLDGDGGTSEGDAAVDARMREANESFHTLIHVAAGSRRLSSHIRQLQQAFPKDYVWRTVDTAEESRKLNIDEHEAVCQTLAARDGVSARKLMVEHITDAGRLMMTYLNERNVWSDS
jgi:DNA-binding GntR family transcriptional regulator